MRVYRPGDLPGPRERMTLEETVEALEAAYLKKREQFEVEFAGVCSPEEVLDQSGRSILLDALVALVNAKAALR